MVELDGLRVGPLALVGLHQAEDNEGDDDERGDQHTSPSSRGVPENRPETGELRAVRPRPDFRNRRRRRDL
jgi:hypothetical protein